MKHDKLEREHAEQEAKKLLESLEGVEEISDSARKFLADAIGKIKVDHEKPKDALGFTPYMIENIYRTGYKFFKGGKYDDAIAAFKFLRLLDISDFRYTFAIAACYQFLGDYKQAAFNYIFCTYLDRFNPLPRFYLYDCFSKLEYHTSAYRTLHEALAFAERDPHYVKLADKIKVELASATDFINKNIIPKYNTQSVG